MGTTADKLQQLRHTKSEIKTAIENKGVEVGDIPFSQYPSKIESIETGSTNTDIIQELKNALIIALDSNPSFVCGSLFAFRACDENIKMYRPLDGFHPSGRMIIYSDGGVYMDAHSHIFDTSKDIPLGDPEKIRYRITLYPGVCDPFSEKPIYIPPQSGDPIETCDWLYVIGYKTHISGSRAVNSCSLRYFGMIDQVMPETTDKYMYIIRGNTPSFIEGVDFTNCNWHYQNTTRWKNVKNITKVNVDLKNNSYPSLYREDILEVFKGLKPISSGEPVTTISIGGQTNSRLTDEDRAMVTSKGWILSI